MHILPSAFYSLILTVSSSALELLASDARSNLKGRPVSGWHIRGQQLSGGECKMLPLYCEIARLVLLSTLLLLIPRDR